MSIYYDVLLRDEKQILPFSSHKSVVNTAFYQYHHRGILIWAKRTKNLFWLN